MKVCFLPFYTPVEIYGSSRIRAKYPAQGINEIDGWSAGIGVQYMEEADVIVVGKMGHNGMVNTILNKRKEGALVILDVADPIFHVSGFQVIHQFADVVTLPTHNLRTMFQDWQMKIPPSGRPNEKYYVPSEVWEDCIDFGLTEPMDQSMSSNVGTFGNWNTIDESVKYLKMIDRFPTFVVCQKRAFEINRDYNIPCQDWDHNTLIPFIRKMGVTILCHDQKKDSYKSDNKLLLSVACGVPALVNEGSAMDWTLTEAGINARICQNCDDQAINGQVNNLISDREMRQAYLDRINQFIFERKTYKHQAQKLIDIIKKFRS